MQKDVETGADTISPVQAGPHTQINGQTPEVNNYEDPSSTIWSVYVSEAEAYDKTFVEDWAADMDGILIFSGLFSASVVAFIIESYKTLAPDPGNSSQTVLLLGQISLQLAAMSNGSKVAALSPPRPFEPTTSALRVNTCWFLSLCFGLGCALTATFVKQWARYYLQACERRPAPHKKARVRAFLFQGIRRFSMKSVVEGIPTLLHIAVFLFLAGLVDFLSVINHFVAYVTLSVAVICVSLYLFITFLPVIHQNCPYRTPLSGICWRIFQLIGMLRYTDLNGDKHDIEGNMDQGREMLATQDSPERDQRDQEALSWTVESLADNMELEPFVEGIPAFLSDGSHRTSCVMRELAVNKDIALVDRIAGLLITCKEPSALSADRRRKRAFACMGAISSLAQVVNVMAWTPLWTAWLFGESLAETLKAFEADKELQARARSTIETVAFEIQSDIVDTISLTSKRRQGMREITEGTFTWDPSDVESLFTKVSEKKKGKLTEVSIKALRRALNVLHTLDSLDAIIGEIPVVLVSSPHSPLIPVLVKHCQFPCIPQLLYTCKDNDALQETERQKRVLCCLEATYFMASHDVCHTITASAIRDLRQDAAPDIVHYASCTTARLACHLQSSIISLVWQLTRTVSTSEASPGDGSVHSRHDVHPRSQVSLLRHCQKLDVLDVLYALENNTEKVELRRVLRLGVDTELSWWHHDAIANKLDQLEYWIGRLPTEELRHLRDLELCASEDNRQLQLPLRLKVVQCSGHIVVLIALLHSIAISPLPTLSSLDFIVETLKFVTQNLSARFSNSKTQAVLVTMVWKSTAKLHKYLIDGDPSHPSESYLDMERLRRIRSIISMCFSVLGTVGAPGVISDAKRIVDEYLALEPACVGAAQARRQLDANNPLTPLD